MMLIELLNSVLMIVWYILAHSRMKLCLFASYTFKKKSIRAFRRQILVYLDVGGVSISRIRKLLVGWYGMVNLAGDMDVEDMSMEDLSALMSEVELTATVVETNYKPITDEDGDSLFRECQ